MMRERPAQAYSHFASQGTVSACGILDILILKSGDRLGEISPG